MKTKTKGIIITLCLASLLAGYAIAEYLHQISMTGFISYDVTLAVTWKDTRQKVSAYDWQDMRHQIKTCPRIIIRNNGTYPCNVRWSANNPSGLQLTAFRYKSGTNWTTSIDMTLDVGEQEEVSFTLQDISQPPGDFSFTINLNSNPVA